MSDNLHLELTDLYKTVQRNTIPKMKRDEIAGRLGYGVTYMSDLKSGRVKVTEDHIRQFKTIFENELKGLVRRDKTEDYGKRRNTVPFYDAEAVGGLEMTEMSPIHAPAGTIDIGDLLHDSSAAIRIYGNSMMPNYPPGCVVGLSKCWSKFIEPGEVYVVETRDRRMLKRLFYKEDDPDSEYFTCYSDNIMKFEGGSRNGKLAYPPFNLHKNDILNMFVVTGVIKRNANSVIINRK